MEDLWVDKYKPMSLDDYVFQNDDDRRRVEDWIKQGWTDNLILVGPAGTGKTSLARVLMNELDVGDDDILRLNASREGNVDTLRSTVTDYIQTGGWGSMHRYIVLNEADGMTTVAQPMLKDDMEEYSDTIRWVLTANKLHKIIHPVQDRCTVIKIDSPDQEQLINRLLFILEQEGVDVDDDGLEILAQIVDDNYPSIRKCIRTLQSCVSGKKLVMKIRTVENQTWKFDIINAFKAGEITKGRNIIKDNMTRDEIEGYIIWLSDHLDLFEDERTTLSHLRSALVANPTVADPEINLSATLGVITQT